MHVIAKPAPADFWPIHPDAQSPLEAWHQITEAGEFTDFNALRAAFASADYVKGLSVFNIGGNKYRLIASIHSNRQKACMRAKFTHAAYERGDGKKE